MTELTTNADLLRRALAMMAGAAPADRADAAQVFADDVVVITPGFTVNSFETLLAELVERDPLLEEEQVDVRSLVTDDERGFAEWTMNARLASPLKLDDDVLVEATGQRIALEGATAARFAGGRIAEMRQYWNEVDMLEAVGLLPAD